jgi:hypothetical protein
MKNFWIDKEKKPIMGMGIGLLGSSEVSFIRKWRFVVEFRQNSKILVEQNFVKMNARPQCPVGPGNLSFTYYDVPLSVMTLVAQLSDKKSENITSIITLYDGCGYPLEKWNLSGVKIIKLDFGELDYSSQEEFTLGMDLSYEDCEYENLTVASQTEKSFSL